MCGIVGYTGTQQAKGILIDGLQHLEYRGYDSAGIAVFNGEEIEVVRRQGKVAELVAALGADDCLATHAGQRTVRQVSAMRTPTRAVRTISLWFIMASSRTSANCAKTSC